MIAAMSDLLPLFPLPNVVLFPNVFLPLHIFEPRYREMVADALAGDRLIGMVLLRPGWEHDYEGRPPVYPIGCSGVITHVERLPDGRYNIVLRGLERFRIVEEDHDAQLPPRDDRAAASSAPLRRRRPRRDPAPAVEARSAARAAVARSSARRQRDPRMPRGDGATKIWSTRWRSTSTSSRSRSRRCSSSDSLRARAESLVELLEMKIMMARTPGVSNVAH